MRRGNGIKTYGRHRNRVIVSDIWFSDSDGKKNIFGTSSENDSSRQTSLFHTSSSSSNADCSSQSLISNNNSTDPGFGKSPIKRVTRQTRHSGKEEKENRKDQKNSRKHTKQTQPSKSLSIKQQRQHKSERFLSHVSSDTCTSFNSTNKSGKITLSDSQHNPSRLLRNRSSNINYSDSANSKQQPVEKAAKRKRAARKTVTRSEAKDLSVNFSDFDDYSLIIQDASIDDRIGNTCVETSTPLAKRTRNKFPVKYADISQIEVVVSPSSDTCYTSLETPYSEHSTNNYSHVTDNFSSPYLTDAFNKSTEKKKANNNVDKSMKKTPESVVLLQKLRESFISRAVSKDTDHLKQSKNSFNHSDSLFSTPGNNHKENIKLLTSRLQHISFIDGDTNDKNESDKEENLCEDEMAGEEEEVNEDVSEEEDSDEQGEGSFEELSALIETEEVSSDGGDSDGVREDDSDSETESQPETSDVRVTRSAKHKVKSGVWIEKKEEIIAAVENEDEEICEDDDHNVLDNDDDEDYVVDNQDHVSDDVDEDDDVSEDQSEESDDDDDDDDEFHLNVKRLNRSLQNNRISVRLRGSRRQKTVNIDTVLDTPDSPETDTRKSDCYLDTLNEHYTSDTDLAGNGSLELFSESESEHSKYLSARSSGLVDKMGNENENSETSVDEVEENDDADEVMDDNLVDDDDDYHTAKETSNRDSLDKQNSSVFRRYSLREQFETLRNSFTEMLTPTKKKGSLLPVSAKTKVMVLCDQTEPISFTAALTKSVLLKCRKIGEGVYGEVFRSSINNLSVAIKIIPIEGDFLVNDEPQKKFEEILPEIVIAKELSDLRYSKKCTTTTFCEVNNVSCVQGKYPATLLKRWDEFDKAKRSENDRPDMFKTDQLYIVFEFADCGTALDSFKFDNLLQSKSVLTQVVYALAVAEESLQFEHRDLHWGNVLVRPTEEEEIVFRLRDQEVRIPTMGVEASVIDYSLSRLTKDGCKVYSDLSKDDSLFEGKGDYQFDIYRKMKETNGNDWEKFCPYTNVLWLHYLADKLVYNTTAAVHSRQDKDTLRQFRKFLSKMLDFGSASEMTLDTSFLNSR